MPRSKCNWTPNEAMEALRKLTLASHVSEEYFSLSKIGEQMRELRESVARIDGYSEELKKTLSGHLDTYVRNGRAARVRVLQTNGITLAYRAVIE